MKRDGRNYCFIKLTKTPAPKLVVGRGPGPDDNAIYYGPFMGATGVGESVRELNDVLGLQRLCDRPEDALRRSTRVVRDHAAHPPGCIRYEVKKVSPARASAAPCSVQQYDDRLSLARAFLDGTHDGPIEQLRGEMEQASERMEYERAAALRDKYKRLEALRTQIGRLRFAVETVSFAYTVPGHDGDDRVYLIRRGRVRAETARPKTATDAIAMMSMINDVFAPVERETSQIPTHEIDELLLLSSWFRRFPEELERTSAANGIAPLAVA